MIRETKNITGVTELAWNNESFHEERKLAWRYALGLITLCLGYLSPQSPNETVNFIIAFITVTFVIISTNSQRSLSKFKSVKNIKLINTINILVMTYALQLLVVLVFSYIYLVVYLPFIISWKSFQTLPEKLACLLMLPVGFYYVWKKYNVLALIQCIRNRSESLFNSNKDEKKDDYELIIRLMFFEVCIVISCSFYTYITTVIISELLRLAPITYKLIKGAAHSLL